MSVSPERLYSVWGRAFGGGGAGGRGWSLGREGEGTGFGLTSEGCLLSGSVSLGPHCFPIHLDRFPPRKAPSLRAALPQPWHRMQPLATLFPGVVGEQRTELRAGTELPTPLPASFAINVCSCDRLMSKHCGKYSRCFTRVQWKRPDGPPPLAFRSREMAKPWSVCPVPQFSDSSVSQPSSG